MTGDLSLRLTIDEFVDWALCLQQSTFDNTGLLVLEAIYVEGLLKTFDLSLGVTLIVLGRFVDNYESLIETYESLFFI